MSRTLTASDRNALNRIAARFEDYLDPRIFDVVLEEVKRKIISKFDCNDLFDGDVLYSKYPPERLYPKITAEAIYNIHGKGWTPMLRRIGREFDLLCLEYLDAAAGSRDPEGDLEKAILDNYWTMVAESIMDERKWHYGYDFGNPHGDCLEWRAQERHIEASRTLTASDRSSLIRLASSLPPGSAERKVILAGLRR